MSFTNQSADTDGDGASTQDDDDISVTDQSSVSVQLDKSTADEESITARPRAKFVRQEKGKKRGSSDVSDREMLEAILQCGTTSSSDNVQQALDEFDSFGASVAKTLRRLGGRQQAWAKVKITELLFQAEFGPSTMEQVGGLRQAETFAFDDQSAGMMCSASASNTVFTVQGTATDSSWDISSPSLLAQAMAENGIPLNCDDEVQEPNSVM